MIDEILMNKDVLVKVQEGVAQFYKSKSGGDNKLKT